MTRGKPTQQENVSWELSRKKKWEGNNELKGGKGDFYVLEILWFFFGRGQDGKMPDMRKR